MLDQINGKLKIYAKNNVGLLECVNYYMFNGYGSEHHYGKSNMPSTTSFNFDLYDQFGSQKLLFGNGKITRSSKWPYQIDLKITDIYLSDNNKKPYFTEIQVIKKE